MPFEFPRRGEVWEVELQAGATQRALVLSADDFNAGPAGIVIVLWITSRHMVQYLHVEVRPQESGLAQTSYVQCDEIQTVKKSRLKRHVGTLTKEKMWEIEERLQLILDLPLFKDRRR